MRNCGRIIAAAMPPTTTMASGFWAWEPIEVASAAGSRPRIAVRLIMTTGRSKSTDPRVTVVERTNVRELSPAALPYRPSVVAADLSFISLRLAVAPLVGAAAAGADLVILVKPQFEAAKAEVGRGGVVRDPDVWRRAIEGVAQATGDAGAGPVGLIASPVRGPAGNVDRHHRVFAADLVLAARHLRETVRDLVSRYQPDVVGLSVMTFQRPTALKLAALLRGLRPSVRVVVGGYDASLAPGAYADPALGIDFLVRGEGEFTFRELLRAIERDGGYETIAGLTWRDAAGLRPDR